MSDVNIGLLFYLFEIENTDTTYKRNRRIFRSNIIQGLFNVQT